MYVIEVWDNWGTDHAELRLIKATRIRVNKLDQDGVSVLFQGVNYWQEGDDER